MNVFLAVGGVAVAPVHTYLGNTYMYTTADIHIYV